MVRRIGTILVQDAPTAVPAPGPFPPTKLPNIDADRGSQIAACRYGAAKANFGDGSDSVGGEFRL